MTKISLGLAALALAAFSPIAANAAPSFQDCSYNVSTCDAGTNLVGKAVETNSLYEGGNRGDLDPFKLNSGKVYKQMNVVSDEDFWGNHRSRVHSAIR